MNARIRELNNQAIFAVDGDCGDLVIPDEFIERFAELIVKECCQALHPMLRDQISRGQGVDLIKKHFGVAE